MMTEVRGQEIEEKEGEMRGEWTRSGGEVDLVQSRIGEVDLASPGRSEIGDEGIHRSSRRVRVSSCHLPTIAEDQVLTLEKRREKPNLELFTIEE